MQRTLMSILVVMTLAVFAGSAQAQSVNPKNGFWIAFGLGAGQNVSTGLDGESLTGGVGYIRAGGTISQQLLVGVDAMGWSREIEGKFTSRTHTMATAMYYPAKKLGLWVKAGAGWSRIEHLVPNVAEMRLSKTSTNGFAGNLGVGYDMRLGNNISLPVAVDWLFEAFSATFNGTTNNSIIAGTVGITIH